MITLMHDGGRRNSRPERPAGLSPEDLGWTVLSVVAAAVLLPAIGLKAAAGALLPSKGKANGQSDLRPPFYGWND
jgi:hypothetical protein